MLKRAIDYLTTRQARKLGSWLLLLIGLGGFVFAAIAAFYHPGYDLPAAAVGLFCFIWGAITGHSVLEKKHKGAGDDAP